MQMVCLLFGKKIDMLQNIQVQQGLNYNFQQEGNRFLKAGKCFELKLFTHARKTCCQMINPEGQTCPQNQSIYP